MKFALLSLAYVVAAFVLSALMVRLAPESGTARTVRRNLYWFLLLPPLLLVDIIAMLALGPRKAGVKIQRLFERLSGRQQYERYNPYNYRPHSTPRRHRKKRS